MNNKQQIPRACIGKNVFEQSSLTLACPDMSRVELLVAIERAQELLNRMAIASIINHPMDLQISHNPQQSQLLSIHDCVPEGEQMTAPAATGPNRGLFRAGNRREFAISFFDDYEPEPACRNEYGKPKPKGKSKAIIQREMQNKAGFKARKEYWK